MQFDEQFHMREFDECSIKYSRDHPSRGVALTKAVSSREKMYVLCGCKFQQNGVDFF